MPACLLSVLLICLWTLAARAAGPVETASPAQEDRLWGVGTTAWLCYRPPCGWRGVFPVAEDGTRGRPLTIHDQPQPPLMSGDPVELAHIRRTYLDHGCLLVEGHWQDRWLVVRRVVGDC